jgi:hypothetical protein
MYPSNRTRSLATSIPARLINRPYPPYSCNISRPSTPPTRPPPGSWINPIPLHPDSTRPTPPVAASTAAVYMGIYVWAPPDSMAPPPGSSGSGSSSSLYTLHIQCVPQIRGGNSGKKTRTVVSLLFLFYKQVQ